MTPEVRRGIILGLGIIAAGGIRSDAEPLTAAALLELRRELFALPPSAEVAATIEALAVRDPSAAAFVRSAIDHGDQLALIDLGDGRAAILNRSAAERELADLMRPEWRHSRLPGFRSWP